MLPDNYNFRFYMSLTFKAMADNQKISRIRKYVKDIGEVIEKEPIMLISRNGDAWISEKANKKLAEKKINTDELLEWLHVGIKHLTEASYSGLDTVIVQMPLRPHGSEVLVILRDSNAKTTHILTAMERKVLKQLLKGLSNKGIASSLNIGSGTVNAHLDNIYRKLDVSSRSAAICTAIKLGIVVPQI
ncbi:MAG: response regulator transcription factor [Nitrospirae bacterium]|nr:MAG: response regulator transcription factor [Nitrospirota bacterium]